VLVKVLHPRVEDVLETVLPQVLQREDAVGLGELVLLLHPDGPQLRDRIEVGPQSAQVPHEGRVLHPHPCNDSPGEFFVLADEGDDGLAVVLGDVLGLAHPCPIGLAGVLLLGVV
jgi:hypothetical protein